MSIEQIMKTSCDKFVARALIDAGYYRASYNSIDKWLWREKGIKLTVPVAHYDYNPIPHVDYYEVHIQYIDGDEKKEHPVTGTDGTPEGAYRSACLDILTMLIQEPPRLNWWERMLRRLGLLGETDAERWYRENVWPLQHATPPLMTFEEMLKEAKKMKKNGMAKLKQED